jgi:hypothetical protein
MFHTDNLPLGTNLPPQTIEGQEQGWRLEVLSIGQGSDLQKSWLHINFSFFHYPCPFIKKDPVVIMQQLGQLTTTVFFQACICYIK